jgi:hypothetical protein
MRKRRKKRKRMRMRRKKMKMKNKWLSYNVCGMCVCAQAMVLLRM